MVSQIYLLLHNIRSTHNVGAILRTADAVGVNKVYLSGITPAPIDRFGRVRKDIIKSSLGAEKTVSWESADNVIDLIKKLKKEKVNIIGVEQNPKAINYKNLKISKNILIIMGNEVEGIDEKILKLCDEIVEITMYGSKESLNVSVATGIILYSLR